MTVVTGKYILRTLYIESERFMYSWLSDCIVYYYFLARFDSIIGNYSAIRFINYHWLSISYINKHIQFIIKNVNFNVSITRSRLYVLDTQRSISLNSYNYRIFCWFLFIFCYIMFQLIMNDIYEVSNRFLFCTVWLF